MDKAQKAKSKTATLQIQIRNPNQEHKEALTKLEKLALWITEHMGTMGFFLLIFAWTILWLGFNTLGPKSLRFDPFPGFVLWLFMSNMIQIFLMPYCTRQSPRATFFATQSVSARLVCMRGTHHACG